MLGENDGKKTMEYKTQKSIRNESRRNATAWGLLFNRSLSLFLPYMGKLIFQRFHGRLW